MKLTKLLVLASFTTLLSGCDGFLSVAKKFEYAHSEPTVQFSSASKTQTNSTGTIDVDLTLSNVYTQEIVVPYTITGTAVAAFSLTDGSVTFQPGETSKTITLTTPNAAGDAGMSTASITLGTPVVGKLGTTTTHTLTIEDPDLDVSIAATSSKVGSDLEFTITQSSVSSVATTVAYATSTTGETATAGTDFTSRTGTATIPAGSTSVKVMVPTTWDHTTYTARTLKLNLSSLANARRTQSSLTTTNAVGTIRDAALSLDFMTGTLPSGLTFKRPQPGTYFDSAGVMRLAAANVPRYDYNPSDLRLNGLLIENGAGQKLYDTEAFDNSTSWTRNNVAATGPTAAVTPMGLTEATLVTDDTVNTQHYLTQTRNIFYTSEPVVFSVFVKMPATGALPAVKLQIMDGGSPTTYATATFDLSAGTIQAKTFGGSAARSDATIKPINNGWYRVSVSTQLGNAASVACQVILKNSAAQVADAYLGAGSGLYVWGANLIDSDSTPSSYVPNSVGYRSPDTLTVNGVSSWYNSKTMTAIIKFRSDHYDIGSSVHYRRAFDFYSTTTTEAIRAYTNPMINSFQYGMVDSTNSGAYSAEAGLYSAIGNGVQNLGLSISANGSTAISRMNGANPLAISTTLPELTTIDSISLLNQKPGGDDLGYSGFNGWIQAFSYRSHALSATDLQTMTSP